MTGPSFLNTLWHRNGTFHFYLFINVFGLKGWTSKFQVYKCVYWIETWQKLLRTKNLLSTKTYNIKIQLSSIANSNQLVCYYRMFSIFFREFVCSFVKCWGSESILFPHSCTNETQIVWWKDCRFQLFQFQFVVCWIMEQVGASCNLPRFGCKAKTYFFYQSYQSNISVPFHFVVLINYEYHTLKDKSMVYNIVCCVLKSPSF